MIPDQIDIATDAPSDQTTSDPQPEAVTESWRTAISDAMGEHTPPEAESPVEAQSERETPDTAESTPRDLAREPAAKLKAPQSWTPAEREEFAKAPQAVQKAALRREAEIAKALQASAEDRKVSGGFREVVAPYEQTFREAGVSAPQAVGYLLQQFAALHTAPPEQRAQILGQMVRDAIGTDEQAITLLAQAIDGAQTPAPQPQGQSPEQIAAVAAQQVHQQYAREERAQAFGLLQQFTATRPEFLNEVRTELVAILEAERMRGAPPPRSVSDLQRVYSKACLVHPAVASTLRQREAAEAAAMANKATARAKVVSGSVKSQPAGRDAAPPPGDDTRSHMEAAWDRVAGG